MNGSWRDQQYPPAGDPFRSLRPIAGWLIGLLALNGALDLVALFVDISYLSLIDRAREGLVSSSEGTAADTRQATITLLQIAAYLGTAITFIIWCRRAYRNLGSLGASWLRFKPGWAVGAWFVPFLNAVRPKEIVNDIWRVSDPTLPPSMDGPALGRPVSPLINLWWAAFLISGAIARVIFGSETDTLDQLDRTVTIYLFGDLWDAVLSGLAIVVVKKITDRQDERWHRLSAINPAPPVSWPAPAQASSPPPPPPPPSVG